MTHTDEHQPDAPLSLDYKRLLALIKALADQGKSEHELSGQVLDLDIYESILLICDCFQEQLADPKKHRTNSIDIVNLARRGLQYHLDDDDVDRERLKNIIKEAVKSLADCEKADYRHLLRQILNPYPGPELESRVFHFIKGETPDEDMVALVQEKSNEKYCAPGGRMEPGRTSEENACRESLEEGGLLIAEEGLRQVIEYEAGLPFGTNWRHFVRKVYLADQVSHYGEHDGKETLGMRYFRMKDLPEVDLDNTKSDIHLIRRAHKHFRDPGMIPDRTRSYYKYTTMQKWIAANSAEFQELVDFAFKELEMDRVIFKDTIKTLKPSGRRMRSARKRRKH